MPILVIFTLTALCMPAPWPAPPFGFGPAETALLTAAAVAVPLLAAFLLRAWAIRAVRRAPERHLYTEMTYGRVRHLLFFVNVGAVVLAVLGLGWGHTVRQVLQVEHGSEKVLAPFAELLVPLPYFLILFGCWLTHYDAERTLHRATALGPSDRPFWSRAGYVAQHVRKLLLLVGLPLGLFVSTQTLSRFAPEATRSDWYKVGSLGLAPLALILFPLLIKPLLGLEKLPPGPARDRFEALAKRLNFRCRDFLLWRTHGSVLNAMITGVLPRARYVVFTDRILDEMPADELDGVLGHEIGHAKHGHLWYYLTFLVLSVAVVGAAVEYAEAEFVSPGARPAAAPEWWQVLPPVAGLFAYVFVVFGFVSRRCERQADVYGCKAVSCADPHCDGHDAETVYPPGAAHLCPTGIRTFARGLDRVGGGDPFRKRGLRAVVAWFKAWQHFTMPRRVAFLLSLIDDPAREPRFQRRVRLMRWGLLLGLAALFAVLGEAVGWRALMQAM